MRLKFFSQPSNHFIFHYSITQTCLGTREFDVSNLSSEELAEFLRKKGINETTVECKINRENDVTGVRSQVPRILARINHNR